MGRTVLMLTFFPIVYTLFFGQPVILMFLGFALAYSAWDRGATSRPASGSGCSS